MWIQTSSRLGCRVTYSFGNESMVRVSRRRIFELYVIQRLGSETVGRMLGCSGSWVRRHLLPGFGIEKRGRGRIRVACTKCGSLSAPQSSLCRAHLLEARRAKQRRYRQRLRAGYNLAEEIQPCPQLQ